LYIKFGHEYEKILSFIICIIRNVNFLGFTDVKLAALFNRRIHYIGGEDVQHFNEISNFLKSLLTIIVSIDSDIIEY
jgi:hypothetical protein